MEISIETKPVKKCPVCNKVYYFEAKFCGQDGTALITKEKPTAEELVKVANQYLWQSLAEEIHELFLAGGDISKIPPLREKIQEVELLM